MPFMLGCGVAVYGQCECPSAILLLRKESIDTNLICVKTVCEKPPFKPKIWRKALNQNMEASGVVNGWECCLIMIQDFSRSKIQIWISNRVKMIWGVYPCLSVLSIVGAIDIHAVHVLLPGLWSHHPFQGCESTVKVPKVWELSDGFERGMWCWIPNLHSTLCFKEAGSFRQSQTMK